MHGVLDRRALILLAVRNEKAAFARYTCAAAAAGNPAVASVLNQLARDEMRHLSALLRRYADQDPGLLEAIDITVPTPAAAVVERLARAGSVTDVLCLAVAEERESLMTYAQLAGVVATAARPILQAIVRRERRHVGVLERRLRNVPALSVGTAEGWSAH